jgi:hypothetical protein
MRAPNRMAEMLDSRIAYSLRSEIRKKIFYKNRVVRSRKSFCEKNSDANGTRFGRKVCMLICIVRDVQMA